MSPKSKTSIREIASKILGVSVEPQGWDDVQLKLDIQGRLDRKITDDLLFGILYYLEAVEGPEKVTKTEETTVSLYNPESDKFETTYDLYGNKTPVHYILFPREIGYYPKEAAQTITKHLVDWIAGRREVKGTDETALAAIKKEVEVPLDDTK